MSELAVVASSSASSTALRLRRARQVSNSFPIDSRSSWTYSRHRPSGLEAWQRVCMVARSVLISDLEGRLTWLPALPAFLPRMIPPSPPGSSRGVAMSLSVDCISISSFASRMLRTSLPCPLPVGSIRTAGSSATTSSCVLTIVIMSSSSAASPPSPSMITPGTTTDSAAFFSTLTSLLESLGGARRADFGRVLFGSSAGAGASSSGLRMGADIICTASLSGAASGAAAGV
mmetsp:Transcript_9302/g.20954  ORF Transcript_9302/g.20954 Transcript_9302/m.20954 type:complete len:231 (-) Transcript_9302:533-1225(-)